MQLDLKLRFVRMKKVFVVLFFVCSLFVPASAKHVAVLETVADSATLLVTGKISQDECRYLTDVFRSQAVANLPAALNFTIMTRENINVMLPPGKSITECEGSCLAETGRNIAADYVAQARIVKVGTSLALSAEMYETAGNKLLASFNGLGETFNDLVGLIKEQSPNFFKKVNEIKRLEEERRKAEEARRLEELRKQEEARRLAEELRIAEEKRLEEERLEEQRRAIEEARLREEELARQAAEEARQRTATRKVVIAGIAVPVAIAGGVLAAVGEVYAKKHSEKDFETVQEHKKNKDRIHKYQMMRTIGIGVGAAGILGLGLNIIF